MITHIFACRDLESSSCSRLVKGSKLGALHALLLKSARSSFALAGLGTAASGAVEGDQTAQNHQGPRAGPATNPLPATGTYRIKRLIWLPV